MDILLETLILVEYQVVAALVVLGMGPSTTGERSSSPSAPAPP